MERSQIDMIFNVAIDEYKGVRGASESLSTSNLVVPTSYAKAERQHMAELKCPRARRLGRRQHPITDVVSHTYAMAWSL